MKHDTEELAQRAYALECGASSSIGVPDDPKMLLLNPGAETNQESPAFQALYQDYLANNREELRATRGERGK